MEFSAMPIAGPITILIFYAKNNIGALDPIQEWNNPTPIYSGGSWTINCIGNWFINWSFDATRSRCCQRAEDGVNSECSNMYCWGCCFTLSCDAACLGGTDYGCICSMDGRACDADFGSPD